MALDKNHKSMIYESDTPAAADNSTRVATTAWLYAALATVMTYFGFAISLATNGYVKFPSILGGLIIQWGTVTLASASGTTTLARPLSYPNSFLVDFACDASSAGAAKIVAIASSSCSNSTIAFTGDSGSASGLTHWFSVGY